MPISTEYIEQLVYKFNQGSISSDELDVLLDWYNSHNDEQVIISSKTDASQETARSRMLANLLTKISAQQPNKLAKPQIRMRWITAVAAAILIFATGIWIITANKIASPYSKSVKTVIEPGGNKATLTLADGRKIELSDTQAGIVAGKEITYLNGTPVDHTTPDQPNDIQNQLSLNTPRGGTYKISLPDGTQIWLNASSTIKYPSQFSPEERIVELEGEAFFQVKSIYSKNGKKIPFKVISKKQEVEVLGTQFNISAYPEQASSKTTLVEGQVVVSDQKQRFILSPNQQAVTSAGKTSVKVVDPANYTAWRDGKFSFDGKTFEETMSEIGRWYNLDIVYENGIPNEELAGDAFRNQNISFVLRLLDVAEIDYKLDTQQRKLIIKGKKNRM